MLMSLPRVAGKSLSGDRQGNVSLLFALVAIPVMGAIGLAVDYGRMVRTQTSMQQALDIAVLAGATGGGGSHGGGGNSGHGGGNSGHGGGEDEDESSAGSGLTSMVRARVLKSLEGSGAAPMVTVTVNPGQGSITARAETEVNSLFMGIFGKEHNKVIAEATAVAGAGGPMEVAIAFDTTHSMAGAKMVAAQQAASELTDLLFHLPGSSDPNPNMKVGLVPFTRYVNVGMSNRNAPWLTGAVDYSTPSESCVDTWAQLSTPVHYAQTCYNDGQAYPCYTPYDDYNDYNNRLSHICTPTTDNYVWHGCVGSQASPDDANVAASAANPVPAWIVGDWTSGECPAEMTRLSNDPNTVKASINTLTEGGETYIAPGLLWGWRLLSADTLAPFHDGGPAASTRKRLILMTDGANTFSASYPLHDNTDVAVANAKTLEVCNNIKAAGIEIYAIAFEVTDASAQTLLAQCASGPPFYYNAVTVADLQGAFHKIGRELMAMRLTK
jgi:Putative Flp pilus-assembly TadE/G-like